MSKPGRPKAVNKRKINMALREEVISKADALADYWAESRSRAVERCIEDRWGSEKEAPQAAGRGMEESK